MFKMGLHRSFQVSLWYDILIPTIFRVLVFAFPAIIASSTDSESYGAPKGFHCQEEVDIWPVKKLCKH